MPHKVMNTFISTCMDIEKPGSGGIGLQERGSDATKKAGMGY